MNDSDYYRRGLQNNLNGSYQDAITDYTKAIEINPSFLEAYLRRGTLKYKLLKQYEESLQDFSKTIELDPQQYEAYLHRGIVKCHLFKFEEGLADFNKTLELNPSEERAYFNRGKVKFMLKYDKGDVCEDLEKAIKLGAPQASDMMKIFYSDGKDSHDTILSNAVAEKERREKKSKS